MERVRFRLLLCFMLLAFAAFLQPYRVVVVVGNSMWPTLRSGTVVILDTRARRGVNISEGDIVVVRIDGQNLVKRVYALGGSKVRGFLGRDEKKYSKRTYRVPDGYLLVIGDNRQDSYDSRDFGPVPIEAVLGKILS
jgi:signal peptidase I